jgi:hypothetical protein
VALRKLGTVLVNAIVPATKVPVEPQGIDVVGHAGFSLIGRREALVGFLAKRLGLGGSENSLIDQFVDQGVGGLGICLRDSQQAVARRQSHHDRFARTDVHEF